MRDYYVYIMSNVLNRTGTLYTGVTNSLESRVLQHQRKVRGGFTALYNIRFLVYCERYTDIRDAIAREKQIKGWRRSKKIDLIESLNPAWNDLSAGWFDDLDPSPSSSGVSQR